MIRILLLAVVPFMTQHRNVVPKTEVSTNFYGSVTGIVDKAYIEARVGAGGGGGGCDTNAVDILANSAVVTNALTVATTNRVAALETATNNLSSSVSGLESSKANKSALAAHIMDSSNPHGVTARQVGAVSSLSPYSGPELIFSWEPNNSGIALYGNGSGIGLSVISGVCGFYALHGNEYDWYQLPTGESGTLALQSDVESKADRPALPVTDGNLAALTADGNLADSGKKASDFLPASSSYAGIWDVYDVTTFRSEFSVGPNGDILGVSYDHGSLYKFGDTRWYYGETASDANEIAVKGDIADAISSTNPTFSNAVLAVGLNIDTNSVAVLNEIAATFGGFPIEGTATTVGGLLAALAAAIAWLKKNKVGSFASVGGATATVENGVAKLDDFFTNSNSLLTGTIDDRLPIPISEKSEGFTTESYKRFVVTVSGDMTVTLHTPTSGDAEIFECRFNGASLSADASITFAGATATTMDANCGTVTAGKIALMSAFWNGTTWDVNWKVEG